MPAQLRRDTQFGEGMRAWPQGQMFALWAPQSTWLVLQEASQIQTTSFLNFFIFKTHTVTASAWCRLKDLHNRAGQLQGVKNAVSWFLKVAMETPISSLCPVLDFQLLSSEENQKTV